MPIAEVRENKRRYMELLLMGDEQEDMVERYLDRGEMYVLYGEEAEAVCVVTDEGTAGGARVLEIKNIAVAPGFRRMGRGRVLIGFIEDRYRGTYGVLQAGTGDSPLTVPFYERLGFRRSHVVRNFFTDNYDCPIFECGRQLRDMVYFTKKL